MALQSSTAAAQLIAVLLSFAIETEGLSLLTTSSDNRRSNELVAKLMKGYSKDIAPSEDGITEVALGIYVVSLFSIREQEMDFSLSFHLRMSWKDPRLAFNPDEVNGTDIILLHDDMWKQLWIPDIAFRNEKSSRFHNMMFPNRLFHLKHDGQLYISIKISATLLCPMDLHKYPFDSQKCPLTMQSITHPKELVIFKWMNDTVLLNIIMSLPQFRLTGTSLSKCEIDIFSDVHVNRRYSCAQIEFALERDKRYYLLQIYIPSFLVVVLSWVSFWISMEAVPARVSIGLVTVLTMATQTNSVNKALPRVSYLKAIDVWMAVCLLFVFGSLLEYSVVNVFSRRDQSRKCKKRSRRSNKSMCADEHSMSMEMQAKESFIDIEQCCSIPIEENKQCARKVDKISRIVFPLVFLVFNIFYWPYYTS